METDACACRIDGMDLSFKGVYEWWEGKYVVTQSGDDCHVGLEYATCGLCGYQESLLIGCIRELWMAGGSHSTTSVVTVETYELGNILHPDFDMPVLRRHSKSVVLATVHSEVSECNQM
jgi:hypothetical protein